MRDARRPACARERLIRARLGDPWEHSPFRHAILERAGLLDRLDVVGDPDAVAMEDTTGPWLVARAVVTDPPSWLARSTPASLSQKILERSSFYAGLIRHALLDEVSLLSPGVKPAEPLAKVVLLERAEKPSVPAARPTSAPARATRSVAGGEVFYGAGPYGGSGVIKRRNHKAEAETDELNRRLEWAERHHGRADFEQILTNLRIELGYESSLHVRR